MRPTVRMRAKDVRPAESSRTLIPHQHACLSTLHIIQGENKASWQTHTDGLAFAQIRLRALAGQSVKENSPAPVQVARRIDVQIGVVIELVIPHHKVWSLTRVHLQWQRQTHAMWAYLTWPGQAIAYMIWPQTHASSRESNIVGCHVLTTENQLPPVHYEWP